MRRYIRSTLNPAAYHGHQRRPPFFEGWYFKLIDADERRRYAVIPGVFLNADPTQAHAFVQVLDGLSGASAYHTFPLSDFHAAETTFDVQIGPNRFSSQQITLQLESGPLALRGECRFLNPQPWPVTLRSPGIMGWYGWLPFMECYHGVVSLDHGLSGSLSLGAQTINFEGGRGYIEKDWGQSFPSAWIWMQTNHFADIAHIANIQSGTCLTASVAMIPSLGRTFRGFIVGLWHAGQLHRFATYSGAVIEKLEVTDTHVTWVMRNRQQRLELFATRSDGGLLHSPSRTEMHQRVMETLQSTVEVCLVPLGGKRAPTFSGVGRNAGLEVQGDLAALLRG